MKSGSARDARTRRAEREGFEPSIRVSTYAGLANRCLQPLGHLSGRVSEVIGGRRVLQPSSCWRNFSARVHQLGNAMAREDEMLSFCSGTAATFFPSLGWWRPPRHRSRWWSTRSRALRLFRTIPRSGRMESSGTPTRPTASSDGSIPQREKSPTSRRRRRNPGRTGSSSLLTAASGTPRSGSASWRDWIRRRGKSRNSLCLPTCVIRTRPSFGKAWSGSPFSRATSTAD